MAKQTMMTRIYPEDLDRLEAVRKQTVVDAGGEHRTMADAIAAALDAWDSAAAKREIARFDARYVNDAA